MSCADDGGRVATENASPSLLRCHTVANQMAPPVLEHGILAKILRLLHHDDVKIRYHALYCLAQLTEERTPPLCYLSSRSLAVRSLAWDCAQRGFAWTRRLSPTL